MQRLAGDFLVKRSCVTYDKDNGNMIELYELPNGQWQFGKGRDAKVVASLDDIAMVSDPGIRKSVEDWLERTKGQAMQPVQQGATPLLAGETVRDRLSQAISKMPEEVVARLLMSIEQVVGPVADSITAQAPVNHHGDGYGQDQGMVPPAMVPFTLPQGARWAQDGRPEAGYLAPDSNITDEKGRPSMQWHPTPQFSSFVDAAPEKTDIELEMEAEREKHQDRELVGAGSGRTKSRRR